MIARVEIEGLDQTGKDTLMKYIDYMSNRTIVVKTRGMMSNLVYADLFGRYLDTNYVNQLFEANKETLIIYLTADLEDLKIRHKIAKHESIDYLKHELAFNQVKRQILGTDILFYEFNTSKQTPYQIAQMVMTIIEEENKKC